MWKLIRYVIPPMVIFEGKRLNPQWTKGEVPYTLYGMSEKGWTDMELFHYWMTNLFIPSIPPARPVLLLVHRHSSNYEPYNCSQLILKWLRSLHRRGMAQ